jgi:hypothetical protein
VGGGWSAGGKGGGILASRSAAHRSGNANRIVSSIRRRQIAFGKPTRRETIPSAVCAQSHTVGRNRTAVSLVAKGRQGEPLPTILSGPVPHAFFGNAFFTVQYGGQQVLKRDTVPNALVPLIFRWSILDPSPDVMPLPRLPACFERDCRWRPL